MITEALHHVLARVEEALGPVGGRAEAVPGTAPGHRLLVEVAGVGPVFLKAADGGAESGEAIAAEAALLTTLSHRSLPRVLAADAGDEVPWLVLQQLSADGFTPPWPRRMGPVWGTIDAVSSLPPPPWLPRITDVDPWDGLLTTEDLGGHEAALQAAAGRVRLDGDLLVHADLGGGNVHVDGRRVTLVDWSDACIGNPDLDRLSVAVDVAHSDGRREAPPVDDLGGWLAKTAGLLLAAASRPAWPGEGGEAVRAAQADLARTAVAWAIDLL